MMGCSGGVATTNLEKTAVKVPNGIGRPGEDGKLALITEAACSSSPKSSAFMVIGEPTPSKTSSARRKQMQKQLISELPEWVPQEPWDGWMEMRRQKKIPTTERAKGMAIRTLSMLKDQGEEIEHVLGQSEFQGWAGLFKVSDSYYQMLGIDRTKQKENAKILKLVDREWANQ